MNSITYKYIIIIGSDFSSIQNNQIRNPLYTRLEVNSLFVFFLPFSFWELRWPFGNFSRSSHVNMLFQRILPGACLASWSWRNYLFPVLQNDCCMQNLCNNLFRWYSVFFLIRSSEGDLTFVLDNLLHKIQKNF